MTGRVIADEVAEASGDAALVDEARRLYRAYPARRGLLLYLLAALDRYGHGKVPWSTFGASFGASVGEHELRAYLGEGSRALSNLAVLWPALSPGFSRATVIAPRLAAYLDDPQVPRYQMMDPWRSLRELVNHLCAERRRDDLAVLLSLIHI